MSCTKRNGQPWWNGCEIRAFLSVQAIFTRLAFCALKRRMGTILGSVNLQKPANQVGPGRPGSSQETWLLSAVLFSGTQGSIFATSSPLSRPLPALTGLGDTARRPLVCHLDALDRTKQLPSCSLHAPGLEGAAAGAVVRSRSQTLNQSVCSGVPSLLNIAC
jgi:hypothetical protein